MELDNIYCGNIAIVDLEAGEVEQEELSEELVEKFLGGAALNTELYKKYKDRDPLILGSGPLTSTFAPSSGMAILTGRSPITGGLCHVPLTYVAAEFKLTGFDFLVILGKSAEPVRIWLHDEIADLDESGDLWGQDVWESVDKLRTNYGDDYVQNIVIGPAGENGSLFAQVSENHWGSKDVFGLGALFGEKKLKSISMRGLGSLEVADGYFESCYELKDAIVGGQLKGKQGFKDMLGPLGLADSLGGLFAEKAHRVSANTSDIYAFNTFFMLEDDPKLVKESKHDAPGILAIDIASLAALRKLGSDVPRVLKAINKLGLAPVAVAAALEKAGKSGADAILGELNGLAAAGQSLAAAGAPNIYGIAAWPLPTEEAGKTVQNVALLSNAVAPGAVLGNFGIAGDAKAQANWWLKRQGLAYVLGIDPFILIMAPEYSDEKILDLLQTATEEEDLDAAALDKVIKEMYAAGLKMLARKGEVSGELKGGDISAVLP